jgi:tetracycline repressor-like protein
MADHEPDPGGDDPFHDLVAELRSFQRGVSRGSRMSLVGTMLQDTTDSGLRARYRQDVIAPRRRRLRAMLERAREAGTIDAGADLDVAVTMLTGSWYARALAGDPVPERWPERAVALVWRALGGTVPPAGGG